MIEFIIDEEYETVRIDRFLRKHLKNIALSEIYKMLRKAKIKVNNKKVSQDYRLVLGDIIFVFLPESFEEKNEETFIELNEKGCIASATGSMEVDMTFLYLKNLDLTIQITR